MSKSIDTLKKEAKRAKLAHERCVNEWNKKRERFEARKAKLEEKWQKEAQAWMDAYNTAEAAYCKAVGPLQGRREVFEKAVKLADDGMDAVMAKIVSPQVIEADRQRLIEQWEQSQDFDAIFNNR